MGSGHGSSSDAVSDTVSQSCVVFFRDGKTEDTELNNILDEICTDKEKRNVKIVQTAAVEVPCCMGIFEKRILIPDKNIRVKNCIILFYMNIHI